MQEFINPINAVIDIMREQGLKYRVSDFADTENIVYVDDAKQAVVVTCAYEYPRCGTVLKSMRNHFLSYENARISDHDIAFLFYSHKEFDKDAPEIDLSLKLREFEEIRIRYFTGRAFSTNIPDGIGRNGKQRYKQGYRSGVMTSTGDIEQEEWERLARSLIEKYHEWGLFNQLLQWYTSKGFFGGYAARSDKAKEFYVLEVHISRIFDCREWVDYIPFNTKYRPHVLKDSFRQPHNNGGS